MSEAKRLTPRQKRFVQEYLVDLNGKRAAMRAGFSENHADACGARLMRDPAVRKAVDDAMAARSKRTQITADRVLREYARIAFADIRNFAVPDEHGLALKSLAELSADDAAAVVELTSGSKTKRPKLRLHDKKKALDSIARHLGLFGRRGPTGESPAAAADRARELILGRLADLARSQKSG